MTPPLLVHLSRDWRVSYIVFENEMLKYPDQKKRERGHDVMQFTRITYIYWTSRNLSWSIQYWQCLKTDWSYLKKKKKRKHFPNICRSVSLSTEAIHVTRFWTCFLVFQEQIKRPSFKLYSLQVLGKFHDLVLKRLEACSDNSRIDILTRLHALWI